MAVTLRDPTVWHWRFFVRWHGRDPPEHILSHEREFREAVHSAMRWTGANAEPVLIAELSPRHTSVRLATIPWHHNENEAKTLEASTLLDAFYLQTGCALLGTLQPGSFAQLRARDWKLARQGHAFLGEAFCLSAEVVDWGGVPTNVARAVLEAWLEESTSGVTGVDLGFGLLAADQGRAQETWVLLVPNREDERARASQMIHRLFPPLLLSRVKGRWLAEQFERSLRHRLEEMERQLDNELDLFGRGSRGLGMLEAASERIARLQLDMTSVVSETEELLATLRISIKNAERLLKDPLLVDKQVILYRLVAEDLVFAAQQVAADLRYSTIRQRQGDRELQSIAVMAEVRDARWGRRTTILLGVFVAFGAAQAFPELSPVARLLIIVIGGLAVYAAIRWASRHQ